IELPAVAESRGSIVRDFCSKRHSTCNCGVGRHMNRNQWRGRWHAWVNDLEQSHRMWRLIGYCNGAGLSYCRPLAIEHIGQFVLAITSQSKVMQRELVACGVLCPIEDGQ